MAVGLFTREDWQKERQRLAYHGRQPELTEAQILAWADDHRARCLEWPTRHSGRIVAAAGEKWCKVDQALRKGYRGLPGGSSLARLLFEQRGRRPHRDLPHLTVEQILAWADAHRARTGEWPKKESGEVPEAPGEKWFNLDATLRRGDRGLPVSSLARLLAEHRGVRNVRALPPMSEAQILAWADAHFQRTGCWPSGNSGPIAEAPIDTWGTVDVALRSGCRGLPGGSSLALFLEQHRQVPRGEHRAPLTIAQILAWIKAHHERTGCWPHTRSGPVFEAPAETWRGIDSALREGRRGLAGGSSLRDLVEPIPARQRERNRNRLTEDLILQWADKDRARTGRWPTQKTPGTIPGSDGDTWHLIDVALRVGSRGLPGGSSLARLLAQHRGHRNRKALPKLTEEQILAWADRHHARTGHWPTSTSGPVVDAPGEVWSAINSALIAGIRGLPGGSSLARLLARHRDVPNRKDLPRLTETQILAWAADHYSRTGTWPRATSGTVLAAPHETWRNIDASLFQGLRGLLGGDSLHRLLRRNGHGC